MNPSRREELMKRVPEDGPPFQFRPDRYYSCMWNMPLLPELTEFGKGGDLTALLWRKLDEPELWHFMFRFRYFHEGPQADPWATADKDKKSWHKVTFSGVEATAENAVGLWFEKITELDGFMKENLDCLPIHGNNAAIAAAIEKHKPTWLHRQTEVQE